VQWTNVVCLCVASFKGPFTALELRSELTNNSYFNRPIAHGTKQKKQKSNKNWKQKKHQIIEVDHAQSAASTLRPILIGCRYCSEPGRLVLNTCIPTGLLTRNSISRTPVQFSSCRLSSYARNDFWSLVRLSPRQCQGLGWFQHKNFRSADFWCCLCVHQCSRICILGFFIRFQKVTFSFLLRDDMHPQY